MITRIGIFDSGIGGVTVLKECLTFNSNYNYLYYSDSLHNPYGDKNKEDIIRYCSEIVSYLVNNGCYIIIIACNTASAIAVEYLRNKYKNVHFIAIEPAVKLVYDNSIEGSLIMATKGTIDSGRFHKLYGKYHHNNYYLVSCVGLADLIENGNREAIVSYLNDNISSYKGKVSNVVLGCTHYPLIKNEIKLVLGNVNFYDGSVGVAMQLKRIIDKYNFISNEEGVSFVDSTGSVEKKKRFYSILNKFCRMEDFNG